MHESSMNRMRDFMGEHLPYDPKNVQTKTVLDVGSMDVCGTYRPLFPAPRFRYTGLDLEPGKNVDIVAAHPNTWELRGKVPGGGPLDYQFDVIISGQCLEHVYDTRAWMVEVREHLKPGGICCIIAPWKWDEHQCPKDYWRIMPDGMRYLLEGIGGLGIQKVWKQENDTIGIATKRED